MSYHHVIIFIFLAVALILQSAGAADPIAVVIKVKGSVQITLEKATKSQTIAVGAQIFAGSKIQTGENSFAAIKFVDDGSLVRIRANSTCVLSGKKEQTTLAKNIFIEVGTIFSKVTQQKSKFQVSTPTSVATVKGTAFWTLQELNGGTLYHGEDGIVEISNDQGSALLKSGETGYVSSRTSKPIVRKTKEGEKPALDDEGLGFDDFDFEFRNEQGESKNLKFKTKKK